MSNKLSPEDWARLQQLAAPALEDSSLPLSSPSRSFSLSFSVRRNQSVVMGSAGSPVISLSCSEVKARAEVQGGTVAVKVMVGGYHITSPDGTLVQVRQKVGRWNASEHGDCDVLWCWHCCVCFTIDIFIMVLA